VATITEALAVAFQHHERGELSQAEQIYRQILAIEPSQSDAWHLLGVAAHQAGRNAEAVQAITQAIALQGNNPNYFSHLGAAYAGLGQHDQAEAAFRQALALQPNDAQVHYNLAALCGLRGRTAEAMAGYRRSLQLNPQMAEAHFNLGNLLRDAKQLDEAGSAYEAALAVRPRYTKAAINLAGIRVQQQRPQAAEAALRHALALDPNNVESYVRLGWALQAQGKNEEAVQALQAAVLRDPQHTQAQNNLGCLLRDLDRLEEAERCFQIVLASQPDSPEVHNNLGSVHHSRKQYALASQCFAKAIALQPDCLPAHTNLGLVALDQKEFDAALAHFHRALELKPESADVLSSIGTTLQMQGKMVEAIEYHRRAIALEPNEHRSHFRLGASLHCERRYADALASYDEAIRLRPDYADAYNNRAFVHLALGDFRRGWEDYEWRLRCKGYKNRDFTQPRWDGTPLAGRTLLIHAEQGLGDTLHFIRYAKLIERTAGGRVFVEVQEPLVPLLKASGFTGVIPAGAPLPKFDVHAPLMSLSHTLGITLDTVPTGVPYLAADPRLLKQWRGPVRNLPGFKVGITWQGNRSYSFDHFRSIPLAQFAPLAEVEGVQLISLQKNQGCEQLAEVANQFTPRDLGSTLDNNNIGAFMETAAVMCNLDLVITSDTATAHLAGGLGVPVWVLLSAAPEWRWLIDRADSPWYPSMRLFRQSELGDWEGVFANVKTELARLVQRRAAR